MRIFAFLFFFQTIAACQQDAEIAPSSAASKVIFRSVDGGQTWQDASAGLPDSADFFQAFASGNEVFLTSEYSLYRSPVSSAAPKWREERFFFSPITAIFPGRNAPYGSNFSRNIFQEIPGTGVWTPIPNALKTRGIRTVFEASDGVLFVGSDDGIYKTTDGGKNWKHIFEEGIILRILQTDGVLMASGINGINRSTDGGEHWESVLNEGGLGIEVALVEGGVAAINFDGERRRIRFSADKGQTWQAIDEGLSPTMFVSDLRQAGEHLFLSHDDGIYRSSDRGKTWKLVLPAPEKKKFGLTVSGNMIFAVVGMAGGC